LIGADACSSSQLNGKEIGSEAGADMVGAGSTVVLGAVKAALGTLKGAIFKTGKLDEPPAAGKNSTISLRRIGASG